MAKRRRVRIPKYSKKETKRLADEAEARRKLHRRMLADALANPLIIHSLLTDLTYPDLQDLKSAIRHIEPLLRSRYLTKLTTDLEKINERLDELGKL